MARRKSYRLRYGRDSIWTTTKFIDRIGTTIATVYADSHHGLSKIIFNQYASKTDKVNVLAACVAWANTAHTLKKRPDCLEYPSFDKEDTRSRDERGHILPLVDYELLKYGFDDLIEFLTGYRKRVYGLSVLELSYRDLRHAARCINNRDALKGKAKVTLTRPYPGWQQRAMVTVEITDSSRTFEFWNGMNMPSQPRYEEFCYDIIPSYHPCRTRGREEAVMVNGATEIIIGGWASVYIYPPDNMRRTSMYNHTNSGRHGSWNYIVHPVVARGSSFTMELDADLLLTRAGADLLIDIITLAFDDTRDYIGINGGFYAPEGYPYPPGVHAHPSQASGAEGKMAWTYHVLEEEGTLDGAFVPRWFAQKNWLSYYASSRSSKAVPLLTVVS